MVNKTTSTVEPRADADVIVVGGGPGGSTSAYHLAAQGLDVLLLEKTDFPRDKACGDSLGPRAVRQLIRMDVDVTGEGWLRSEGVRVIADDLTLQVEWPDVAGFPGYGLTRTRLDLDHLLAKRAVQRGARLQTGTNVTGPILDRTGRVTGVRAAVGPEGRQASYSAPLVIAADGAAGRLGGALGISRRTDRPLGVAVRRYYHCPGRHADPYLDIWLSPTRLPNGAHRSGYAWIFGLGDGRVNVGLGTVGHRSNSHTINHRQLLERWLAETPPEWQLADEQCADGPVRGAGLPIAFNRTPHYREGLMLVGDCGGMINPLTGEGIAFAMEAGELAAEVAAHALNRPAGVRRESALAFYPRELRHRHGGYYRLGMWLAAWAARPAIRRQMLQGLASHQTLRALNMRLSNMLTDPRSGDAADRLTHAISRIVPKV